MQEKPSSDLFEVLINRFVDNPKAIAQLKILEKHHKHIADIERQLSIAQAAMKNELAKMSDILALLEVTRYELPNGFYCQERTYREIKIVDSAKFMRWLKANCTPNEIVQLLTPPTRLGDVYKFLDLKFEEKKLEFDFEIDGVVTKSTYTVLKTGVKANGPKAPFKKEFEQYPNSYRKERSANYQRENARQRPKKFSGS